MKTELQALIRRAFDAARQSRVPTWHRMTTAVLKNRLLQLSDGKFNEADYGYSSLRQLIEDQGDLLVVDTSTRPVTVELKAESGGAALPRDQKTIRPDLWRAVTDYTTGRTYVWDAERRCAVEAATTNLEGLPKLPTITADDLSQWRRTFADNAKEHLDGSDIDKLNAWASAGLAADFLPSRCRTGWSKEFSSRVHERLVSWFAANNLEVPPLTPPRPEKEHRADDLRKLVLRCVEVMTHEELEELRLPAPVLLRIHLQK